jgi:predicted  nucleic acid-binding Zn-ribbon protein
MLETIERLLILQDRDKKVRHLQTQLARIEPERQELKSKEFVAQQALDRAKQKVKELESCRKELELEVQAKKQLIEKYSLQQFQTRKNDEYRALAHEIEMCKGAIFKIEDQELELMEQGESAQKDVARATQAANETKKLVADQVAQLNAREANLKKELGEFQSNRAELAAAVEDNARSRYERLVKSKGENVVVGVSHGVCGGCHMRVPAQILVSCQQQQEIVSCTNCGRILYYTRDMDLAAVD